MGLIEAVVLLFEESREHCTVAFGEIGEVLEVRGVDELHCELT